MEVGLRAFSVLLLSLGCADCPPLLDTPVHDEDGLADEARRTDIARALADFQAWTDGTGVCVEGIDVVPATSLEPAAAHWASDVRRIRLGDRADFYWATIHELCHAWDQGHSWPSLDMPARFQPDSIDPAGLYTTRDKRQREAFARLCEAALLDQRVMLDWDARCEAVDAAAGIRWAQANVWVDRPAHRLVEYTPLTFAPHPLPDLSRWDAPGRLVATPDTLHLVARRPRDARSIARDLVVTTADATTGTVTDSHVVRLQGGEFDLTPGEPRPRAVGWDRIHGDWGADLDPATGTLGAREPAWSWGIWRQGDVMWTSVDEDGLVGTNLHTGQPARLAAAVPHHHAHDEVWTHLESGAPGRALVRRSRLRWIEGSLEEGGRAVSIETLGEVDLETGEWRDWPLPDGASGWGAVPLGGTDVLVSTPQHGIARLAPDGRVIVPDDCTRVWLPSSWTATTGDRAWTLTRDGADDDPEPWTLTAVTLPRPD